MGGRGRAWGGVGRRWKAREVSPARGVACSAGATSDTFCGLPTHGGARRRHHQPNSTLQKRLLEALFAWQRSYYSAKPHAPSPTTRPISTAATARGATLTHQVPPRLAGRRRGGGWWTASVRCDCGSSALLKHERSLTSLQHPSSSTLSFCASTRTPTQIASGA